MLFKFVFNFIVFYCSFVFADSCTRAFSSLVREAAKEILESRNIIQTENFFRDRAVEISRREVDRIVRDHIERLKDLRLFSDEVRNCHGSASCLKGKGVLLIDKVKLVYKSLSVSFFSEKRAREEILDEINEATRKWVEENYERLKELNYQAKEIGEIKLFISDELRSVLLGRPFSVRDFFYEIGLHFKKAFEALSFRELRNDRIARTDYRRNLTTVLSIQFGAHLMHALEAFLSGKPLGFFNKLWIYCNTAFMMSIQAEVGARNQRKTTEPLAIRNFGEFLRELPNILIGDKGFWRDSQRKFLGFLTLLPLEYAVTVAAKAINVMAERGAGSLLQSSTQAEIALVNLASTAIFGTYLSLKWTLIDKWLYLNLLPSVRASTMKLAEERLVDLKDKNLVPNDWTLKDFVLAIQKPRLWQFWKKNNLDEKFQYLEEVLMSNQSKELIEAYQTSRRAQRFEWAWRYGTCLIDSYIVFGLFGSWIPKLFGF